MTKRLLKLRALFSTGTKREKGQVLILVTFTIVGLLAIVGLALDAGIMFLEYSRLRRAVDAAALASALQYRKGYNITDLGAAAVGFLQLNGVNDPSATIDTCDTDISLCTVPLRKLVRVRATATAQLAFLPIIGIDTVDLSAMAISEAASVDVVLVIDTSESMTWDVPVGDPLRDPSVCNIEDTGDSMPGECHPFEEVKQAAVAFIDQLYFPYDRVAIVTFGKIGNRQTGFSNDEAALTSVIEDLVVFEAEGVCPSGRPCRNYSGGFQNFGCGDGYVYPTDDPGLCMSTNVGEGFLLAGNEFALGPIREESLWVVILLGDGAANGGQCPSSAWGTQPFCRDASSATRHCADPVNRSRCEAAGGVWDPDNYDADDYARDMADFVAYDQQALIFTIGLGNLVTNSTFGDPDSGQQLLQYAADSGGGLYYFAPSVAQLRDIFQAIAENIAIRLSQ
ncbi:MAG: VWA domain-containing protein [Chloroflexota bacterium]